jgi:hypothetical protein
MIEAHAADIGLRGDVKKQAGHIRVLFHQPLGVALSSGRLTITREYAGRAARPAGLQRGKSACAGIAIATSS